MDTAADLDELIARLTPRQMEVAVLLADGKTGVEVATILSISNSRIKQHVARMCVKLGVENRVQLIVLFARWQAQKELPPAP